MAVDYLNPEQGELVEQLQQLIDRARSGETVGVTVIERDPDGDLLALQFGDPPASGELARELFAMGADAIIAAVYGEVANALDEFEDGIDPEGCDDD